MKTTNQRHCSLPLIIRGRILLFPVVLFFSSFLIFSVVRFFIPSRLTMWISGLGVPNIHGTDGIGFFCWETYRAPLRSYRLLVIILSVVRILLSNFFFYVRLLVWFHSVVRERYRIFKRVVRFHDLDPKWLGMIYTELDRVASNHWARLWQRGHGPQPRDP